MIRRAKHRGRAPRSMQAELQALFDADGCLPEMPGIESFDEDEYADVNGDEEAWKALPGLVAFASDRGGARWYAIDTTNLLGRGEGAVFTVDRGSMLPETSAFVAKSLAGFQRGLRPGRQPRAKKTDADAARARLDELMNDPPPSVTRGPSTDIDRLLAISDELCLPPLVRIMLAEHDGWRFASGDELFGIDRLSALPEPRTDEGRPVLLVIGQDRAGRRHILLRDNVDRIPRDTVVTVSGDEHPAKGEQRGLLPEVLVRWMEAGAPAAETISSVPKRRKPRR